VTGKPKAIIAIAALTLIGVCYFSSIIHSFDRAAGTNSIPEARAGFSQLDNCADCHKKHDTEVLSLYSSSVHAKSKLTCNRCHGGDVLATEKEKAHAGNFVGMPDPKQIISMCGSCHKPQLAMYKDGAHVTETQGKPRLDCSQCHGAHAVGSPTRNFSFAYFCAGCHGLEYLPELPPDFQKMLKAADEVTDLVKTVESSRRALSAEQTQTRKEIRRRIAEIVHPTDSKGGKEKIPEIIRISEEFKKSVGQK
jgi:hypothetical protein